MIRCRGLVFNTYNFILVNLFIAVVAYIQGYGWFIVAFLVFAMYAISKLKPKIDQLKQSAVDGVFKKTGKLILLSLDLTKPQI